MEYLLYKANQPDYNLISSADVWIKQSGIIFPLDILFSLVSEDIYPTVQIHNATKTNCILKLYKSLKIPT